jgi:hypothetical protein
MTQTDGAMVAVNGNLQRNFIVGIPRMTEPDR